MLQIVEWARVFPWVLASAKLLAAFCFSAAIVIATHGVVSQRQCA
jgi:hypothetical protein